MENKEIVVLLDGVSRTIAGYKDGETETTISVKNPVIVNAMPNQNGQMSLQLIPVFFREILEDKNQECVFEYNKSDVTQTNITNLDAQIVMQYAVLFKDIPTEVLGETDDTVVDLFEGETTDA